MFMYQHSECDNNNAFGENVCWLVPQQPSWNPSRYKSSFAAKVRWDSWSEKKGCCKTIGPPPKILVNCPEHFLRKHSRQVPVFFAPEELRITQDKEHLKRFQYQEPPAAKRRLPPLNTGLFKYRHNSESGSCPFPHPPCNLGLFRHPLEPTYEEQYRLAKSKNCDCDSILWEELLRATECAGRMAAQLEKQKRRQKNGMGSGDGPVKDFIRSNAIEVIRLPARRLRRCYVDQCGVHLIDMSDSPYVLRPGFGKVPPYIYRRKMELLRKDIKEKRALQTKEQDGDQNAIQPVDERDKEMVIQGLKNYWEDLQNQYNSLSLNAAVNERHRELKLSLEERMKEVEQDLRLITNSSALFVGDVKESRYL